MQYKALSLLFLSATALAAPGPQNTDSLESNPEYQEYMSSLESAASKTGDADFSVPTEAELDIPTSILAVLATAMPASFISQLNDPSAVSSLDQDWKTGKTPDWYSKLPDDVKDYVSSQVADSEATATNSAEETGSSTGKSTAAGSASATATRTSDSSSSAAQTTGTQTTGSSSASSSGAAETTGSQGATSEGGAPAPTGAMAASFAGAAGILGLAIAL